MWTKLHPTQKKIAIGAGALLVLTVLFPPLSIERKFSGLTDGTNMYQLTHREFGGWGYIGSIDFSREPEYDPDSLYSRWRAMTGPSLDEIRSGTKRLHTRYWLMEIVGLLALTGAGLYLTRTKLD